MVRKKLSPRVERMDEQALDHHLESLKNDGLITSEATRDAPRARRSAATAPVPAMNVALSVAQVQELLGKSAALRSLSQDIAKHVG